MLLVLADEVQGAAFREHFHALLKGRGAGRSAHGVDDQIRADAVGEPSDRRHGVFVSRVDHVVGPQRGGKLAAQRRRVDRDEPPGVNRAHDLEDQAADESLAQDQR